MNHYKDTWEGADLESLYQAIYAFDYRCPTCSARLDTLETLGIKDFGYAECNQCQRTNFVSFGKDPLRDRFKPFTPEDKADIMANHQAGGDPVCPNDGTTLSYKPLPTFEGTRHHLQCRRCGHAVTYAVEKSQTV